MRLYYRSSLFLYEIVKDEPTPLIVFWRATVYTFGHPASKTTLKRLLREYAEGALVEPQDRRVSWEERQVSPSDSRSLGFNWIEVSRGWRRGPMLSPEVREDVLQLQAYERNLRLGPSEFLREAVAFGKTRRAVLPMVRYLESFWEWLSR